VGDQLEVAIFFNHGTTAFHFLNKCFNHFNYGNRLLLHTNNPDKNKDDEKH